MLTRTLDLRWKFFGVQMCYISDRQIVKPSRNKIQESYTQRAVEDRDRWRFMSPTARLF